MSRTIYLFLILLITLQTTAQTKYENTIFGFKIEKPENWEYYESTEFDKEENECNYIFYLSSQPERLSEWDNRLTFIARGNGFANSLADVHLLERQRLYRTFKGLKVIEETDSTLLVQISINDISYHILTLVNYKNSIGYLASYSFRVDERQVDQPSIESFFESIIYSIPLVKYEDLDKLISESPEDATLYFKKAKRKFGFHNFEGALVNLNHAIDRLPHYGEAYYLRGYTHLALENTLEACRDFESSDAEDYGGYFESMEHCNTREISEALSADNMNDNPFHDIDPNANPLDYVDSIRSHKYVLISNLGPPSQEIISYMNHLNHLFELDFKQLDSIYMSEDGILKLYSFGIISTKFPDKINREHKKMLKTKGKTMVLKRDQKDPYLVPTKELAALMFEIKKAQIIEKKNQLKTEKAIKSFIRNYSKYKDSYEPLSFVQFHVSRIVEGDNLKTVKNTQNYIIGHSYKIKDSNGNFVEVYNTFKLDYAYKMNIIEGEKSNTFSAYPPRVKEWLDKYGRILKDKDKKKLGILN